MSFTPIIPGQHNKREVPSKLHDQVSRELEALRLLVESANLFKLSPIRVRQRLGVQCNRLADQRVVGKDLLLISRKDKMCRRNVPLGKALRLKWKMQELVNFLVLVNARKPREETLDFPTALIRHPHAERNDYRRIHQACTFALDLVLRSAERTTSALVIILHGITAGVFALRELRINAVAKARAAFGSLIVKFAVMLDVAIPYLAFRFKA